MKERKTRKKKKNTSLGYFIYFTAIKIITKHLTLTKQVHLPTTVRTTLKRPYYTRVPSVAVSIQFYNFEINWKNCDCCEQKKKKKFRLKYVRYNILRVYTARSLIKRSLDTEIVYVCLNIYRVLDRFPFNESDRYTELIKKH